MKIIPCTLTGNKILDSTLGQGLKNLFGDVFGAVQIIGSLIIVCVFAYVCIKKSRAAEEEQERKRYTNAQITLAVLIVLLWVAVPVINLILSYFGVSPITM